MRPVIGFIICYGLAYVSSSMVSDSDSSVDGSLFTESVDDLPYISAEGEDSDGFDFGYLSTGVYNPEDMHLAGGSSDEDDASRTHPFIPYFFEPPAINPAAPRTSDSVWPRLWDSDDYVKHRVHQLTLFPIPLFPPSMIGEARDPFAPPHRAPIGHPGIQRAFLIRAIQSGITTWPELSVLLSCFCTTSPFLGMPYHQLVGELLSPRPLLPVFNFESGNQARPVA